MVPFLPYSTDLEVTVVPEILDLIKAAGVVMPLPLTRPAKTMRLPDVSITAIFIVASTVWDFFLAPVAICGTAMAAQTTTTSRASSLIRRDMEGLLKARV